MAFVREYILSVFGSPRLIVTDNGPAFAAAAFGDCFEGERSSVEAHQCLCTASEWKRGADGGNYEEGDRKGRVVD